MLSVINLALFPINPSAEPMNEPITKSSPLALTAPVPKAAARSDDQEIFRGELSYAAQLSHQNAQLEQSKLTNRDSSESRLKASNDKKPIERESTQRVERSEKQTNDDAPERDEISAHKSESDSAASIQADDNQATNTDDSFSLDEPKSSEEENLTGEDNLANEATLVETSPLQQALLAAIEKLEGTKEQINELEKLFAHGSAVEFPEEAHFIELLETDPALALQLAFETLGSEIDLSNLVTSTSEELDLQEVAFLDAENGTSLDGNKTTVNPNGEVADSLVDIEANNNNAVNNTEDNLAVSEPATSQALTDTDKSDKKLNRNGSIDTANLAKESSESEAEKTNLPRLETATIEPTSSTASGNPLADDGKPVLLPQEIPTTTDRNAIGQTNNLALDRAEANSRSPKSESGPQVDPARFVTRVAKAFETAQTRGGGPIEIRLSPPELGSLQLRLEVKEGVLTASLETDNQAARNALLDNLPALRERLAEQQIRIEKFDVDVRDDSSRSDQQEQQANAQNHRDGRKEGQDRSPRLAGGTNPDEIAANEQPAKSIIYFPEDGINVVA